MAELIGEFHVQHRCYLQDESGRFLGEFHEKCRLAAFAIAEHCASMARVFAPKGRTGSLAASIRAWSVGGTEAVVYTDNDHAAPQEFGAGPHTIGAPGQFLVDDVDAFQSAGPVLHPGNPATHFMLKAAEATPHGEIAAEILGE